MSLPTEDVVLYSIIAFIVIENFIEIYLSRRQVSHKICSDGNFRIQYYQVYHKLRSKSDNKHRWTCNLCD